MRHSLLTLICLWLAAASPDGGTAAERSGVSPASLSGVVLRDGKPFPFASVFVFGASRSARTDSLGRFSISGLEPGVVHVRAHTLDASTLQEVQLAAGKTATVRLALARDAPTWLEHYDVFAGCHQVVWVSPFQGDRAPPDSTPIDPAGAKSRAAWSEKGAFLYLSSAEEPCSLRVECYLARGDGRVTVHDRSGRQIRLLYEGPLEGKKVLYWNPQRSSAITWPNGSYRVRLESGDKAYQLDCSLVTIE